MSERASCRYEENTQRRGENKSRYELREKYFSIFSSEKKNLYRCKVHTCIRDLFFPSFEVGIFFSLAARESHWYSSIIYVSWADLVALRPSGKERKEAKQEEGVEIALSPHVRVRAHSVCCSFLLVRPVLSSLNSSLTGTSAISCFLLRAAFPRLLYSSFFA